VFGLPTPFLAGTTCERVSLVINDGLQIESLSFKESPPQGGPPWYLACTAILPLFLSYSMWGDTFLPAKRTIPRFTSAESFRTQ
jgi:hypothetical protein